MKDPDVFVKEPGTCGIFVVRASAVPLRLYPCSYPEGHEGSCEGRAEVVEPITDADVPTPRR
jgi:hypothetical protein